MAMQNIIKKAQELARDFNPEKLKSELLQYNESLIEKYVLIGATTDAIRANTGSIAEAISRVNKAVDNATTVKYAYTFFRVYPKITDTELSLKKFAPLLLDILQVVHVELAKQVAFKHNKPTAPEFLYNEDIDLLAARYKETLSYLTKVFLGEPTKNKVIKEARRYLVGDDESKKPVKREIDVAIDTTRDEVVIRVPVKALEMEGDFIVVDSTAKVIEVPDDNIKKINITAIVIPVEE